MEREERLRGALTKEEYEVFCRVMDRLGAQAEAMLRGESGPAGRSPGRRKQAT